MELTELQKLHYDAIKEYVYATNDIMDNDGVSGEDSAAIACAKITEREKLTFAIEQLTHAYDAYAYQLDDENEAAFKKEIAQLQQQLNELEK